MPKNMSKKSKSLIGLSIIFGILFVVGYVLVLQPMLEPYPAKIILQDSEIYGKPIFLIFNWETVDEIQVGDLITLNIEVIGLPYTKNMDKPNIELFFEERYLNYWSEDRNDENEILPIIPFKLEPNLEWSTFSSQDVDLRFIIPDNTPIQYCDYQLEPACYEIQNIIQPAPYDLKERIKTNRTMITASLFIVGLSATLIWHRLTREF